MIMNQYLCVLRVKEISNNVFGKGLNNETLDSTRRIRFCENVVCGYEIGEKSLFI